MLIMQIRTTLYRRDSTSCCLADNSPFIYLTNVLAGCNTHVTVGLKLRSQGDSQTIIRKNNNQIIWLLFLRILISHSFSHLTSLKSQVFVKSAQINHCIKNLGMLKQWPFISNLFIMNIVYMVHKILKIIKSLDKAKQSAVQTISLTQDRVSTNLTLLCIAACRRNLRGTWSTVARQFHKSLAVDNYA